MQTEDYPRTCTTCSFVNRELSIIILSCKLYGTNFLSVSSISENFNAQNKAHQKDHSVQNKTDGLIINTTDNHHSKQYHCELDKLYTMVTMVISWRGER